MSSPLQAPTPIDLELDLLTSWLEAIQSVSKNASRETLSRFQDLILSFPGNEDDKTVSPVINKLKELSTAKRPYSPTLCKITESAITLVRKKG